MSRSFTILCLLIIFGIQQGRGQGETIAVPEKQSPPKTNSDQAKGNTKTKQSSPVVAKPAVSQKYVVKSGDNPWVIAKAHGITLAELLKANEIRDAKNLMIGDVLILPMGVESKNAPTAAQTAAQTESKTATKKMATPAPVAKPTSDGKWDLYTIKSGDNPWTIAKSLGLDHQQIIKLNEGLDFTKLNIGQEIKIPKK
tara:strand:+ start:4460 stop:5053 length:594 start_codon:yes stop_codon:yes gene_type:complete